MRFIPVLLVTIALTGCDLLPTTNEVAAVDANHLAPLSSREQSLIFAADGAFQQGNYAAAERDYMTAVAESKGKIDAHLALARLYDKQQMPQKEREILERAIKLQPNHAFANYVLGKLYLNADEYTLAQAAFERGRITRPDDADLTIGAAVADDMLGNHKAAQRLYIGLMRANPVSSQGIVRTNLAMSYLLSDDAKEAVDLLKDEATKPGASPVARHNLALAYGLLGRNSDAKTLLNGEIDEETRQLAVARMQAYHRERALHTTPVPMTPTITELASPPEIASPMPAPVVTHPTAPAPVAAQPKPKTITLAPTPASKPELAPSAGEPESSKISPDDPNYIPGLVDDDSNVE